MPRKKSDAPVPSPAPRRRSPRAAIAQTNGSTTLLAGPRIPSYEEIAEAAYLRYLNRGGGDGADFDDWVEAERELSSRSAS